MLNSRQQLISDFIYDQPGSGRAQIEQFLSSMHLPVSKMTITRDLALLIAKGLIVRQGLSRQVSYYPAQSLRLLTQINVDQYFAKNQDQRLAQVIGFNDEVFAALPEILTKTEQDDLTKLNQRYLTKREQLSPAALRREMVRVTIDLAWKSSQIEGNTYTLLETEELIRRQRLAPQRTQLEATMILNHKRALDLVWQNATDYRKLTLTKIEELHRALVSGLGVPFNLRNQRVAIIGTNYQPADNEHQLRLWLSRSAKVINQLVHPVAKALVTVLMISYVQPFLDGNKRTARLLGDALLLAHDYCPISYRSVNEVEYKKALILFYERQNASYFKQLFLEQFAAAVNNYF